MTAGDSFDLRPKIDRVYYARGVNFDYSQLLRFFKYEKTFAPVILLIILHRFMTSACKIHITNLTTRNHSNSKKTEKKEKGGGATRVERTPKKI